MNKKAWIIITLETIIFSLILGIVIIYSNSKVNILEHNINAYKDTIEHVTLKNNELLISKNSLILSESELREELDISKNELKELKQKLNSKVAYISKLESNINIKDTIYLFIDTIYTNNNIITKKFLISDEWLSAHAVVEGHTIEDSKLSITSLNIPLPVSVGLTDDYTFFVKTPNPYVTITNINGAVVNKSQLAKREKHFHHGIYLGFGINYGIINKSLDIGPSFGYCISYTF